MIELSVPEMSCGHCHKAVTGALLAVPGVKGVAIDASERRAKVEGEAAPAALIAALAGIGYDAKAA